MDNKLITEISFHRDKEDNWEIQKEAKRVGFDEADVRDISYLGYEVIMKIEITDATRDYKVLEINGIDVSDKNITI